MRCWFEALNQTSSHRSTPKAGANCGHDLEPVRGVAARSWRRGHRHHPALLDHHALPHRRVPRQGPPTLCFTHGFVVTLLHSWICRFVGAISRTVRTLGGRVVVQVRDVESLLWTALRCLLKIRVCCFPTKALVAMGCTRPYRRCMETTRKLLRGPFVKVLYRNILRLLSRSCSGHTNAPPGTSSSVRFDLMIARQKCWQS